MQGNSAAVRLYAFAAAHPREIPVKQDVATDMPRFLGVGFEAPPMSRDLLNLFVLTSTANLAGTLVVFIFDRE